MPVPPRLRRLTIAALPAIAAVALTACNNAAYPNSIFHSHTEFNREVGTLFKILIYLGTAVFIFVEQGRPHGHRSFLGIAVPEVLVRTRRRKPLKQQSWPHYNPAATRRSFAVSTILPASP